MARVHSFFSKLNGFFLMIQAITCDADHLISFPQMLAAHLRFHCDNIVNARNA